MYPSSPPSAALPRPTPWDLHEVFVSDAQPRRGVRCEPREKHYAFRPTKEPHPFGMVLSWERSSPRDEEPHLRSFVQVKGTFAPVGPGGVVGNPTAFKDWQELDAVFAAFGRSGYSQERRNRNDFLVAQLPGPCLIKLRFLVDTEDDRFLELAERHQRAAEASPGLPFEMAVGLHLFDAQKNDDVVEKVRLVFASSALPGWDAGLVGIDLGHSSTTMCWLGPLADSSTGFLLLNAQGELIPGTADLRLGRLEKSAPPVSSNLQLTHVDPKRPRHLQNRMRWSIGVQLDSKTAENTFVSVKRLLTERALGGVEQVPTRSILLHRKLHPAPGEPPSTEAVPSRLPAELFCCRLFQRFREHAGQKVRCFAVSYPTTYSQRELQQVRLAAFRAWLRMQDEPQDNLQLEYDPRIAEHFPLALDEASAAGYFVLHRKVFEKTHGLARFRYLHPEPFHLLLFDCGGGTTDIGLLRAEVLDRPLRLSVRVIGRSGKRSFGGDNITEAIFQLVKANLAALISLAKGDSGDRRLELPTERRKWPAFLAQQADRIDQLLPTRFDPDILLDDGVKTRRRVVQDLWQLAEAIKEKLAAEPAVKFTLAANSPLDLYLNGLLTPKQRPVFDGKVRSIAVRREEVDALVGQAVRECVEACNHLIHEKLTARGEEVQAVALAGNGTRYPLFLEEMRAGLAVPFLDERLEGLGEDELGDLKNAVAKGVALALASKVRAENVECSFDETLAERIPFHLAYRDKALNDYRPLLRENQRYDELANGSPPLEVYTRPRAENEVLLYRQWPGDRKVWPYLLYRFSGPIREPIRVRYDVEACEFVVSSGQEDARLVVELIEDVEEGRLLQILADSNRLRALKEIYFSPVQRGTL